MSKTAKLVVQAFLEGRKKKVSNTRTDGNNLYLFGNKIAWIDKEREVLTVTNCGWFSNTSKDRLNTLPNVHIKQYKGQWYIRLGNHYKDINEGWNLWDGKPVSVELVK